MDQNGPVKWPGCTEKRSTKSKISLDSTVQYYGREKEACPLPLLHACSNMCTQGGHSTKPQLDLLLQTQYGAQSPSLQVLGHSFYLFLFFCVLLLSLSSAVPPHSHKCAYSDTISPPRP